MGDGFTVLCGQIVAACYTIEFITANAIACSLEISLPLNAYHALHTEGVDLGSFQQRGIEMTKATTTKQVTKAIRKAGYAVDCVKGDGYVYFIADDMREIDSVYVCYLYQQTVEEYVEHVARFFN